MNGKSLDFKSLKEGQKIDISANGKIYSAYVLNVYGDSISLQMPIKDEFRLRNNEVVEYFIPLGSSLFSCKSFIVASKEKYDNQFVVFSFPRVISRAERRKHIKIPCLMLCAYSDMKEQDFKETFMIDISQGGMKFFTIEEYEEGKELFIKINVPEEILLVAEVVRKNYDAISGKYKTAVKFTKIEGSGNQQLVTFIHGIMNNDLHVQI